MPEIELHQFRFSHFNEKARWALDFKGVPHRRVSYLPGPHMRPIRKLSGQSQVPVVRFSDGAVVAGSAAIIDALETRFPEPALYPDEPQETERALEIQRFFDEEVGPQLRRTLFAELVEEPGYLAEMFASDAPWLKRTAYRATLPAVKPLMCRSMGLNDPELVERSQEAAEKGFAFLSENAGPQGYLVGDQFSVADLAAAAILAPAVNPDHPDMSKPEPMPPAVERWCAQWKDRPGAAWVRTIYRRHRGSGSTASLNALAQAHEPQKAASA